MQELNYQYLDKVDRYFDKLAIENFYKEIPDKQFPEVLVVIAAYKEKDNIKGVLESIPNEILGLKTNYLVVVDGENDGTYEIARDLGGLACLCPINRGQGAAFRIGYDIAYKSGAKYVITMDADGQCDTKDLEKLLYPVKEDLVDVTFGSRVLGSTYSKLTLRNFGVRFFAKLISHLTGYQISDPANPLRAFVREIIPYLYLSENQYQSSQFILSVILSNIRFSEVPVNLKARNKGASKKGNDFIYGLRFFKTLIFTYMYLKGRVNK
jgi:glycosyltransferase involved in cell wall biosynthesis